MMTEIWLTMLTFLGIFDWVIGEMDKLVQENDSLKDEQITIIDGIQVISRKSKQTSLSVQDSMNKTTTG